MPPRTDLTEIGVTGLNRVGGYVFDEPLKELQGHRWPQTIKQMLTDPVVGAAKLAIELLCRQVSWDVVAGDKTPDAEADAMFTRQCLGDMSASWEETLAEILSFLPWGWSYLETVYKYRGGPDTEDGTRRSAYTDGKIGWRKWAIRSQDTKLRWEYDDQDGGIAGLWQQAPPRYEAVLIPIQKALLFRATVRKGSPEGESILRAAFKPWFYAEEIQRIEAIGIERDLAGLPVAYAPAEFMHSGASQQEQATVAALQALVTNIRRNEGAGVVFPLDYDQKSGKELYKLELLTSGGARQIDTETIIQRYHARIAGSMLADFLLLGHGKVGTQALSVDKSQLFTTAVNAWLDVICGVVNSHAIPRLLRLNGRRGPAFPALTHGKIERPDLGVLGAFVAQLASAGVALPPEAVRFLFEVAGIPVPADFAQADDQASTEPDTSEQDA